MINYLNKCGFKQLNLGHNSFLLTWKPLKRKWPDRLISDFLGLSRFGFTKTFQDLFFNNFYRFYKFFTHLKFMRWISRRQKSLTVSDCVRPGLFIFFLSKPVIKFFPRLVRAVMTDTFWSKIFSGRVVLFLNIVRSGSTRCQRGRGVNEYDSARRCD